MIKKLTKTGNSLALVFDRSLLEAAGIDVHTPLEVSTNGQVIVISPVRPKGRRARLRAIVQGAHREYGGVFRRLAGA
jgi:antitoxin component of MazEF toxin-antitoxin module